MALRRMPSTGKQWLLQGPWESWQVCEVAPLPSADTLSLGLRQGAPGVHLASKSRSSPLLTPEV